MEEREAAVRRWFGMWLEKKDLGIGELFAGDARYIESWGPEYRGAGEIRHWFEEWNTRGTVLRWEIRGFFHRGEETAVTWYFEDRMEDGRREAFEGVSLVRWREDGKIAFLQEFGCRLRRYDPYRNGPAPEFDGEAPLWF